MKKVLDATQAAQIPLPMKSPLPRATSWVRPPLLEGTQSRPSPASDAKSDPKANEGGRPGFAGPVAAVPFQEIDEKAIFRSQADAPPCHVCGTITVRAGACYACPNCGATSGCS